jgi:CRISPR-associated protein (TIGR02710 family)
MRVGDEEVFTDLREQWLQLVRRSETETAQKMYWEDLFPYVEGSFVCKYAHTTPYDWLILPCGLESSYYILLIKALKPRNVYFLGTEEFKMHFLDTIIQKTDLKPSQYLIDTLHYDELDITDVYEKVRSRLRLFVDKKVVMDLTRGKRIMSVGAGIVGAFFGFDLVYVDEVWLDDVKRGLPGSEKLVLLHNPFEVFGDLELREARDFLNHHNYGAALALYKRIRQKIVDPRTVEIEELLSEAYLHWNSFNFKAAASKIKLVIEKCDQYHIRQQRAFSLYARVLDLLSSTDSAVRNSDDFQLHVILDLYANALRKAEMGVFEDAISRMYRVLELLSQYRLKSYGIETHLADLHQYAGQYKALTKEIYGFEKEVPFEIGLKDGYLLLYILKDYLVENHTLKDLKDIFGVVRARDMSIIAHGLQLAGEKVFINLNELARTYIRRVCAHQGKDLAVLFEQHTFVKL